MTFLKYSTLTPRLEETLCHVLTLHVTAQHKPFGKGLRECRGIATYGFGGLLMKTFCEVGIML